jgi:hypothetical protein
MPATILTKGISNIARSICKPALRRKYLQTELVIYGDSIVEYLHYMESALGIYQEAIRTAAFGISGAGGHPH